MLIRILGSAEPLSFAASELSRLVRAMGQAPVEIRSEARYDPALPGLWLGTFNAFPAIVPLTQAPSRFDDEIYIQAQGQGGVIAGLCPRSVLIAVYRYATELGCRFLSVGPEGEKIPQVDISSRSVSIQERPSYRHRGVCIEGAVSVENVIEMIDFLPKLGMNSYFIQFREAYIFFDRWYNHALDPERQNPGALPVETAREYVAEAAREMEKRGILYHAVGHGWTCEPFGVPGLGWDPWTKPLPERAKNAFAMIGGERKLWYEVPLNTQACYSNPEVRQAMLEDICRYIQEHPTVDVLHFWLADGSGNHCECPECVKHRPSDFYVQMLNDLDEMLTQRGLDTKIVFLIYVDLLWPPVEQTIRHPERFLIMFAPITRSYRKSFCTEGDLPPISGYARNACKMPVEVAENVAYLKAWQTLFPGNGFDYDYHYMWAFQKDPGRMRINRVLSQDLQNLKNLGLDGYISCQVGRAMLPDALALTVMGRTLWERDTDFDALCRSYYADCYGDDGPLVLDTMNELSDIFFEINLEEEIKGADPRKEQLCQRAAELMEAFSQAHCAKVQESIFWRNLLSHAWITAGFSRILAALYRDDRAEARALYAPYRRELFDREDEYQSVFDVWNFINVLRQMVGEK